jgi:hypothetical protein
MLNFSKKGVFIFFEIKIVETPGIEPGSKQATKIVSTCLFFD